MIVTDSVVASASASASAGADSGPRLLLARGGELVLIGVLTFVCSVPLVTAAAAQAAAWQTLDHHQAGEPGMTGSYFRAFWSHLRRGIALQLLWLAVAVVAGMDLWFGLASQHRSPPAMVFAGLGGLGVVFVLIIRPFLAARLLVDDESDRRLSVMIRLGLATAGISPWRTALVLALEVGVIFSGTVALIFVPAALAVVLPLQWRLISASTRAVISGRASRRRPG